MKNNHNILKEVKKTFLISSQAKTKEEAFQKAFEKMKIAAYKEHNNLIVSLKTANVKLMNWSILNQIFKLELEISTVIQYIDWKEKN